MEAFVDREERRGASAPRVGSHRARPARGRRPGQPCLGRHGPTQFVIVFRVILIGASTVAFVMPACGGSTTGSGSIGSSGSTSSGGAAGAGGSWGAPECTKGTDCGYPLVCVTCPDGIDSCPTGANCVNGHCVTTYSHECGANTGGTTGTGGAQGSSGTGGRSSVSPGKVSIEFTVTGPESYCAPICPAPEIEIQDASGRALVRTEVCRVDCGSCIESCPSCLNIGTAITGIKMDWDGAVYQSSTCGAGLSCLEPTFASPGRYTAMFCATRGTLAGPDGGLRQCVTSGPPKCGTVTFDFPSSVAVKGTVGP